MGQVRATPALGVASGADQAQRTDNSGQTIPDRFGIERQRSHQAHGVLADRGFVPQRAGHHVVQVGLPTRGADRKWARIRHERLLAVPGNSP